MRFQCPVCHKLVAVNESQMGFLVECGHCNEEVMVPSSRLSAGSVIADFVILKEIGRGGMGVVYLAHQISLDRPAALKILQDSFGMDAEFVVNFIKEARLAAKLNHPHIVQAYAVGEDEGIFYFAMEYIDGETMKQVLQREKVIQVEQAVLLVQQVAEALDCAWKEQKLVHRDIKPDNIMLTKKNQAKLADLGLSMIANDLNKDDDSDEVMGTPQYISPEQLTGAPVDVRSDIYSLGATFYQFVTGRFPFEGRNATEIARKHLDATLVPPIQVNSQIPEVVSQIICKMMKKNANDRYQDAETLVEDLRMFRRGKFPGGGQTPPSVFNTQTGGISMTGISTSSSSLLHRLQPTNSGKIEPPAYLKEKLRLKAEREKEENESTDTKYPTTSTSIKPLFKPDDNIQTHTSNNLVLDAHGDEDLEDFKPRRKIRKIALIIVCIIVILAATAFIVTYMMSNSTTPIPTTNKPAIAKPEVDLYSKNITQILKSAVAGQEQNFLKMADDFLEKYPEPKTTVQQNNLKLLLKTYVELDEKLRIPQKREKARAEHLEKIEINREQAARAAELKAKQEAERRKIRQEEEERRRIQAEARKQEEMERLRYIGQIQKYRKLLPYELTQLINNDNHAGAEKLRNDIISTIDSFQTGNQDVLRKVSEFKSYSTNLITELKKAVEYHNLVYDSGTKLRGLQIETRVNEKRALLKVQEIRKGIIISKDAISGKSVDLKISDMDEELFSTLINRIERRAQVSGILFYIDLHKEKFSDNMTPPNDFWKQELNDFQRNYFIERLKSSSSAEKTELYNRFGKLKNFPK